MTFRFRKTKKILPGLRLNLGKRGISASVGKRGASVNISKRGLRSTIGIPGTGLSYSAPIAVFSKSSKSSGEQNMQIDQFPQPNQTISNEPPQYGGEGNGKKKSKYRIPLFCGGFLVVGCIIIGAITAIFGNPSTTPTPTATIISKSINILTAIPSDTDAPLPSLTNTLAPSPIPSETLTISPSDTPQPSDTIAVALTDTPAVVATIGEAPCACTGDLYNCDDLSTYANAQACYDYCIVQGMGDIHELDQDDDGIVCESLP